MRKCPPLQPLSRTLWCELCVREGNQIRPEIVGKVRSRIMMPNTGVVAMCPGSNASWQLVRAFAATEGLEESSLTFFAPPSPSALSPGCASAALCCAASASGQHHNRDTLAELAKLLKPGSKIYVHDAALVRPREMCCSVRHVGYRDCCHALMQACFDHGSVMAVS